MSNKESAEIFLAQLDRTRNEYAERLQLVIDLLDRKDRLRDRAVKAEADDWKARFHPTEQDWDDENDVGYQSKTKWPFGRRLRNGGKET